MLAHDLKEPNPVGASAYPVNGPSRYWLLRSAVG
jgi:hypothetical protein